MSHKPRKGVRLKGVEIQKITQQSTHRSWLLWRSFSKSVSIYPRSTPAASTCKRIVLRKKISTHSSILLSPTFVMIHLIIWHPVFVLFLLTCFPTIQNHFNLFTPKARKCVHETFKSEDQILWLSLNFQVASSAYHLHSRTRHSIWKTSENVGLEVGGGVGGKQCLCSSQSVSLLWG